MDTPLTDQEQRKFFEVCLKSELKLSKDGKWFHDEREIAHARLQSFLHRILKYNEELKRYELVSGPMVATFELEGAPYFVSEIGVQESTGEASVVLLGDRATTTPLTSLCIAHDQSITCTVFDIHKAKILRNAHQSLIRYAISENTLRIGRQVINLTIER